MCNLAEDVALDEAAFVAELKNKEEGLNSLFVDEGLQGVDGNYSA
jgi:hypothetical protein